MISCNIQRLTPKLKGGCVEFTVEDSLQVHTDRLPVVGRRFRYWLKGQSVEMAVVREIERPLRAGYSKTYRFVTGREGFRPMHWRITITDPIFAGS